MRVLAAAVVEAAILVDVVRRRHHVDTRGVRAGRRVLRVVDPVPDAAGHLDAVRLVTGDGQRERLGVRPDVRTVGARPLPVAAPRDGHVVVVGGLVVDLGDRARGVGAERILRRGVGVPAGRQQTDIRVRLVRGPLHLVQRTVVRREQRACGAVRTDTRRPAGGVDVTRERRGRVGRCHRADQSDGGTRDHYGHREDARQQPAADSAFHSCRLPCSGATEVARGS